MALLLTLAACSKLKNERRKVAVKSEVSSLFAEFRLRQQAHLLHVGEYLSSSATNTEADAWPASLAADGGKVHVRPFPKEWTALRMDLDQNSVRCSYVTIVGKGDDSTNVGEVADDEFSYSPPAIDWYYLLARCDMDQDPSVDSYYFQTSENLNLYFIREGR